MLALRVALVARRPSVALPPMRVTTCAHMWREPKVAREADEIAEVATFVGTDGSMVPPRARCSGGCNIHSAASRSANPSGLGGPRISDQSMAVLDQQMAEIRQLGFVMTRAPIQARIRNTRKIIQHHRAGTQACGERSQRAIAGNAPRHRWHPRQRRHCGICNLQKLKGLVGFESHPLRQLPHSRSVVGDSGGLIGEGNP